MSPDNYAVPLGTCWYEPEQWQIGEKDVWSGFVESSYIMILLTIYAAP